jgi:hypothetical protein
VKERQTGEETSFEIMAYSHEQQQDYGVVQTPKQHDQYMAVQSESDVDLRSCLSAQDPLILACGEFVDSPDHKQGIYGFTMSIIMVFFGHQPWSINEAAPPWCTMGSNIYSLKGLNHKQNSSGVVSLPTFSARA